MASPAWYILVIAFAVHALVSAEDHYQLLEDLHHELDDYISGLETLQLNARMTLDRVYTLQESQALAKHRRNTDAMLLLANQRKCQLPIMMKLNHQSQSWLDRFTECMNLTQTLVYFESTIVKLYEEYEEMRPVFCEGANNLTLCLQESSFFDRMVCSYRTVEDSADRFQPFRSQILQLAEDIQNEMVKTITEMKGCFGQNDEAFLTTQEGFIDTSCQ